MKNPLKISTLCLLALVSLAAISARAQSRDKPVLIDKQTSDSARPVDGQTRDARLLSARAGGINLVSGDVKARRAGSQEWQSVSVKDDLKTGDAVRTGADGRVEVLLNPGSYLRAGASTEFELTDASLDSLHLNLLRGSVLVEATGYDKMGLNIQVTTPRTRVELGSSGVYRIEVAQSGETVVSVEKGRALVGDGLAAIALKGGKVARVGASGAVEIAKLDKKQRDDLDQWSRERGRELARVNTSLASRQTNSMLASNGFWDFFRAEYPSSYLGMWIWSMQTGCYTFLPFGPGWRSPYGFNYGGVLAIPDSWNNCWGCSRRYQPFIVQSPNNMPVNNGVSFGGVPPSSSSGGSSAGSSSSSSTTFGSGGSSNRGGGTVASPPPSAPVERPMRERTYEPGSRPIDH